MQQFVRGLVLASRRFADAGATLQFAPREIHDGLLDASPRHYEPALEELLTPLVREQSIDIVHTHNVIGMFLMAMDNWALRNGVVHVTTYHDVPSCGFDRRAISTSQASHIATQSEHNRSLLQTLTETPVHYLPLGIDFSVFSVEECSAARCIAFPARLAQNKGIVEGIDVLQEIARRTSRIRLLLSDVRRSASSADGTYLDRVLDAVARSPDLDVDFVHDDDGLAPMYAAATLTFCWPLSPEGFCLTALEGLACGRPVIGRFTGGMKDWLPQLPGAVQVQELEDTWEAIEGVFGEPEKWLLAARQSRAMLEPRYDFGSAMKVHAEVYATVLDQTSRQAASAAKTHAL